jgi:hypothetical protein
MATQSFSMRRAEAVVDATGKRHCANCGDYIDPIDWCPDCQKTGVPCCPRHKPLRKRSDAAFCDASCRSYHRSSYARDCL